MRTLTTHDIHFVGTTAIQDPNERCTMHLCVDVAVVGWGWTIANSRITNRVLSTEVQGHVLIYTTIEIPKTKPDTQTCGAHSCAEY